MTVDLPQLVIWMREGTARCRSLAAQLNDAAGREPSGLPGWTRGHLLTHLARNADALVNLLTWARTGVPTPMYASREQRDADIAAGAGRTAAQLRDDLTAASGRLAEAVAAMRQADWNVEVRSAQGRALPARQVPWLRTREVWVHAVDLAAGTTLADLPANLVDALLDDVTAAFAVRGDCPPLQLRPTDRSRGWELTGSPGSPESPGSAESVVGPEPVAVAGSSADLLGWLIGRTGPQRLHHPDGPLPTPPAWL